jgi:hypothetical protein
LADLRTTPQKITKSNKKTNENCMGAGWEMWKPHVESSLLDQPIFLRAYQVLATPLDMPYFSYNKAIMDMLVPGTGEEAIYEV